MVSDFDRAVRIARGDDLGAVALSRLVDRVGQDLKDRVLAALQSVRAEDNARRLRTRSAPFSEEMLSLP